MVGFCRDASVIGSDFYVMEKLDGTILRRELPWPLDRRRGVHALCRRARRAGRRCTRRRDAIPELAGSAAARGTSPARSAAGSTASRRRAPTTRRLVAGHRAGSSAHQPADVASA
jgi:hypothetical protein